MDEFEKPCLCYARTAMQTEPERYHWVGGTLWATYAACPAHPGEHFVSPVWAQGIGRLDSESAAETALTSEVEV